MWWTKLASILRTSWSIGTGMNAVTWVLLAMLLAAVGGVLAEGFQLDRERLAHNATRTELERVTDQRDQAVIAAMGLKDAVALTQKSAKALQVQVQNAQLREAEAVRAANQRAAILDSAKSRPVNKSEIMEVVDNATRQRVADYLNRPLQ